MEFVLLYLLTINAAGFLSMLVDKHKAKKNQWRIPERTLLSLCALGGSLGGLLGMKLFRHKTLHLRFSVGIPVMLAVHVVILVFLVIRFA